MELQRSSTSQLNEREFIGEADFMLHEAITAKYQTLRKTLVNDEDERHKDRKNGVIKITGE